MADDMETWAFVILASAGGYLLGRLVCWWAGHVAQAWSEWRTAQRALEAARCAMDEDNDDDHCAPPRPRTYR